MNHSTQLSVIDLVARGFVAITLQIRILFLVLLCFFLCQAFVCATALAQYELPPPGPLNLSAQTGLAPNSYPLPVESGGPMVVPPPPLSPLGQDLGQPLQLNIQAPKIDSAPAESELVWYYPWTWVPRGGWTNSAELGINGTDGNSKSFSFQTGARFKRKTDDHLFEWKITHNKTNTKGLETQNNALMYTDYEKLFRDSPWSWFNKLGMEYDEFKAFDLRLNMNTGLGYRWVDTKALRLATRFGAGTSREIGGPDNRWVPEAVFGGDYDHQINTRNKVLLKFDYFPEWTNFSNYRVVTDFGWEYLLDEKGNLSMKLGANDRYDSTPNGRKPNDINYTFMMLYKF